MSETETPGGEVARFTKPDLPDMPESMADTAAEITALEARLAKIEEVGEIQMGPNGLLISTSDSGARDNQSVMEWSETMDELTAARTRLALERKSA